jgi:uncharacterized ion transporter superfamily protein YfcC
MTYKKREPMSIQEKESDQDTKFVKEADDNTKQFIFQKNKKTKVATAIIVLFLIILIAGIVMSGVFFGDGD